jgi:hypothetical protein
MAGWDAILQGVVAGIDARNRNEALAAQQDQTAKEQSYRDALLKLNWAGDSRASATAIQTAAENAPGTPAIPGTPVSEIPSSGSLISPAQAPGFVPGIPATPGGIKYQEAQSTIASNKASADAMVKNANSEADRVNAERKRDILERKDEYNIPLYVPNPNDINGDPIPNPDYKAQRGQAIVFEQAKISALTTKKEGKDTDIFDEKGFHPDNIMPYAQFFANPTHPESAGAIQNRLSGKDKQYPAAQFLSDLASSIQASYPQYQGVKDAVLNWGKTNYGIAPAPAPAAPGSQAAPQSVTVNPFGTEPQNTFGGNFFKINTTESLAKEKTANTMIDSTRNARPFFNALTPYAKKNIMDNLAAGSSWTQALQNAGLGDVWIQFVAKAAAGTGAGTTYLKNATGR